MPCRCKVNLSRYHKLSWMLQNVLNHLSEGGRMILNTIFQVLRCIGIRNDIWTLIVFSWLCSFSLEQHKTDIVDGVNKCTIDNDNEPPAEVIQRRPKSQKKNMTDEEINEGLREFNCFFENKWKKKNWLYYFNQNLFVSTFASQYELSPLYLLHSEFIKLKWMQGSHLSVKEVCKLLFL